MKNLNFFIGEKLRKSIVFSMAFVMTVAGIILSPSSYGESGSGYSGSGSGPSTWFQERDTPVDCSTSEIVYNYVNTSGSGSGGVSGGYGPGGASGSISGSGSGSSTSSGVKGVLYTQKKKTPCKYAFTLSTCTPQDCTPTGNINFTPIP